MDDKQVREMLYDSNLLSEQIRKNQDELIVALVKSTIPDIHVRLINMVASLSIGSLVSVFADKTPGPAIDQRVIIKDFVLHYMDTLRNQVRSQIEVKANEETLRQDMENQNIFSSKKHS